MFAKLKGANSRSRGTTPPHDRRRTPREQSHSTSPEPPPSSPSGLIFAILAFAGSLAFAAWWLKQTEPPPPAESRAANDQAAADFEAGGPEPAGPERPRIDGLVAAETPSPTSVSGSASMPPEDMEAANRLAQKINTGSRITDADVENAENLYSRYAADTRDLLELALVMRGGQLSQVRRYQDAEADLQRAVALNPDRAMGWMSLGALLRQTSDWSGAEAAYRELIERQPRNGDAHQGLAFALFRQDRNREAIEALRTALEIRDNANDRTLLARLEKGREDEAGMREQQLAHFHVRYDGGEHEAVGREVLRALERHYSTLLRALDHQPETTIPVILFSREAYFDASGAPAWSGGQFDGLDGRVRVPIGGLTASLTPHMDGTLIHELTHAFINDITRGTAPREIHEGLAQYMEGERIDEILTKDQLAILASGRAGGVSGFYMYALTWVEFLVRQRGMGGMREVLLEMGKTGKVGAAFQAVHSRTYQEMMKYWKDDLRRRHGS